MPSPPQAGSTFDQFLPKAKAMAAGSSFLSAPPPGANVTSAEAVTSGKSKPTLAASLLRRSREPAAPSAAAGPPVALATDPTTAAPSAAPDLSTVQLGFVPPPVDPAPLPPSDTGPGGSSASADTAVPEAAVRLAGCAEISGPPTPAAGAGTPPAPAPAAAGQPAAASDVAPASAPSAVKSSEMVAAAAAPPASPVGRFVERPGKEPRVPSAAATAAPLSTPASAPEAPAANDLISDIRIQPAATVGVNEGAKNAALPPAVPHLAAGTPIPDEKKSLISGDQSDKMTPLTVGIDTANASPAVTLDYSSAARLAPPPPISAPAGTASAPASPVNASARTAVDAVIKLLDVQTGRSQEPVSAVSLNFKFGGDDLAVRVEWRNGEVHTQFRTDSPELRSALASQWQATAPNTGNRTTPFAAPVFSSSGDPSASASRDEREARQPGDEGYSGQPGGSRTPRPKAPAPSASLAASVPLRTLPISTTLRLHTFA